jgi:hypothetical protein
VEYPVAARRAGADPRRHNMARMVRKLMMSTPVTIGGVAVLGALEFVALQRSRAIERLQK